MLYPRYRHVHRNGDVLINGNVFCSHILVSLCIVNIPRTISGRRFLALSWLSVLKMFRHVSIVKDQRKDYFNDIWTVLNENLGKKTVILIRR